MLKNILFSILITLFASSCQKDNIETLIAELPKETTSGLNTFGCLINNKVWIPTIDRDIAVFTQETKLALDKKNGYIFIEATLIYRNADLKVVKEKVYLSITGVHEAGKYSFVPFNQNNDLPPASGAGYFSQEGIYDKFSGLYVRRLATGTYSGKTRNLNVNITRLDFDSKICSGTFEFTPFAFYSSILIDEINITKGRFDLKTN